MNGKKMMMSSSMSSMSSSSSSKKCDDKFGYPDSCNSIKEIPTKINYGNIVDRSRSGNWQFYCDVFERYYATSHCVNERCGSPVGPSPDRPPIDLQFGNPIYDEMEKGICLLLQFHDDICPADPAVACQCDSAYTWNPSTERCDRYTGTSAGTDLALIRYCENLTGGNWNDSLSGSATVSNECLRGCTRYIATEGHACCPYPCDCTAQNRPCLAESCAYCRACCESCGNCGANDYPNECRKKTEKELCQRRFGGPGGPDGGPRPFGEEPRGNPRVPRPDECVWVCADENNDDPDCCECTKTEDLP